MVQKKVIFRCHEEMKPRKAQLIATQSQMHCSLVRIRYKNSVIDAKSTLTILGASIKDNEEIVIECHGDDEMEALDRISEIAAAS